MRFKALLLTLLTLLATTAAWPAPGRALESDPPKVIVDFELTSQDGKPLRLSALQGRPVLLFFGFVNCPDVCPMALGKLQLIAQSPDMAVRDTRMVMISVDGDRDKPADLKRYLKAAFPDVIGLTGDPRKVRDIANQFSAVFFKGMSRDDSGQYLVDHTSQVYLLDRRGRLRHTFFNAGIDEISEATRRVALEEP